MLSFKTTKEFLSTHFDMIVVSESWLIKNKLPPVDVSIPDNIYKFCPREAIGDGTLIYIRNHFNIKLGMTQKSINP